MWSSTFLALSLFLLPVQPRKVFPLRIAFQGEPGAYSEKAVRELLGPHVIPVPHETFESCFSSVSSLACDYCLLPIENSLGGSIHENYDLMLRYDLKICSEYELRVSHCLIAVDGVKLEDVKFVVSHPQALAQCEGFLRQYNFKGKPMYDTAGSVKVISEDGILPEGCTKANTAAIASSLAAETYSGVKLLKSSIEDDDCNFTRFLLLGRQGVSRLLPSNQPKKSSNNEPQCKTTMVFTLGNTPGALYKALACFSLRDIDFSKIESRPTSAFLLQLLKYGGQMQTQPHKSSKADPRFRYCFYLDILSPEHSQQAKNAIKHLKETANYCRVLGSYPIGGVLVGEVKSVVEGLKKEEEETRSLSEDEEGEQTSGHIE